ncbi:hypothetical protein BaRGS_00014011 [Batillaria attramentaria]|uniref:Endothelin-converting enzyme 1 n=1 Tax=Batillaria attramentaria TaxID=370345 RepID=A0ABD0L5W5_9CAEN
MTDAPFGRSDSEDDIIEDYDDVVTLKGPCCKGRTPLERALLVLIVLLLIVIIGLAVGLTRPKIIPRKDYCKSAQCVQAASSIMAAMDPDVDPCDDFFQYACGGWVKQNPIPKGYHKWDRVQELSGQNLYMLKTLIELGNSQKQSAEGKVRTFFDSCMADGSATRRNTLQKFKDMIHDVDGWSVSIATNASRWYFPAALEKIHRLGAWPLFRVTVDVDERDPTKRNILKIDLGETVVPADMYPPLFSTTTSPPTPSATTPRPSDNPADNDNSSTTDRSTASPSPSRPALPTPGQPLRSVTEVKQLFVDETVPVLQALGFNSTLAAQRATLMAELEHRIAAATEGKAHIHDRFSRYNVITIGDLEANYGMIPWVQYFATLGFKVTPDDQVVVFHPSYLSNLTSLVHSLANSRDGVDHSVLRDYMVLTLARSFKPYFDLSLFNMEHSESDEMQEQWKRCTFYTNKAMGFATGAIFVRGTGQEGNVDNIQKLIKYVREAFKEYILRKFWIDKNTRVKAEKKVDSIINKISYPFSVETQSWFDNLHNWQRFELQRQNKDLHSVPDRKQSWIRPPVTVNAFYSPIRNDVIFPIAMFHLPYYIPGGPSAVNFGAMGSVIGRQYDEEGRLNDWWDPHTSANFDITTPCMIQQYNNITIMGQKVDGDFTLDENIADNGGLRAARYAFMKWIEEQEDESPLPSLNLTNYQVFFLSYAQMYCSKWTKMGLRLHLLTDPHSPGAARVNGALANSKTFSWAYQCPVYSRMNARTKCEVW